MVAVVFTEAEVLAVQQGRLIADTADIIEPDYTFTLAKVGSGLDRNGRTTVHGSAYHLSVSDVPLIITHGSPPATVQDFHSARAPVRAIDKP